MAPAIPVTNGEWRDHANSTRQYSAHHGLYLNRECPPRKPTPHATQHGKQHSDQDREKQPKHGEPQQILDLINAEHHNWHCARQWQIR
ncbi:hypothetical protein A4U49_02915 [Acidithiobacillus ferrivorans]|nr:hypothetical protein A4U49_02915 [Acidithiobacillus ferrivorans]